MGEEGSEPYQELTRAYQIFLDEWVEVKPFLEGVSAKFLSEPFRPIPLVHDETDESVSYVNHINRSGYPVDLNIKYDPRVDDYIQGLNPTYTILDEIDSYWWDKSIHLDLLDDPEYMQGLCKIILLDISVKTRKVFSWYEKIDRWIENYESNGPWWFSEQYQDPYGYLNKQIFSGPYIPGLWRTK